MGLTVNYFLLGMADVIAMIVVGLKVYGQPVRRSLISILFFSAIVAGVSYFNRIILELPVVDFAFQAISTVLFLRFIISIKLLYSILITAIGLILFIVFQLISSVLLDAVGYEIVTTLSLDSNTQLLQLVTEIIVLLVAAVFKLFNYQFTFITIPPHDFSMKERLFKGKNKYITIAGLIGFAAALTAMAMVMNHRDALIVLPIVVVSLIILYYVSDWRNKND